MTKRNTVVKVSLKQYILRSVAFPSLLLLLVFLLGFIVHCLIDNYQAKKTEARRFAQIIARSAAIDNFTLVSDLVAHGINADSAISDIHFYSIENTMIIDDQSFNDWENALFRPSVNIYEEVIKTAGNSAHTHALDLEDVYSTANEYLISDKSQDKMLIGYINLTLDLTSLRKQWFSNNLALLASLPLTFFILLLLVYLRLRKPSLQVIEMSSKAQGIIENDDMDLSPIIHSKKGFYELELIRQLISKLYYRNNELNEKLNLLKHGEDSLDADRISKSENRNIRNLIIHELKNALNEVLDGMKLLDSQYVSNEQAEAVSTIRQGSKELDTILKQVVLLDLIDKGLVGVNLSELQPAQLLNSLVQDYQSIANEKGLEIDLNISHVDHVLAGDVKKVRNIIAELISNAIRFTSKGSIAINSRMDYFADSIRWTVKVEDTGVGIEEKHLNHPSIHLSRTHDTEKHKLMSDSIGLGVVQKLTQLLGGELKIESIKDRGTTFTLVLQLQDWRNDELYHMLSAITIAGLEVDDSELYINNLETFGATVHTFTDPITLLEYLANNSIDLMLVTDTVNQEEVEYLCHQIREREEYHRILIGWYQTNIDKALQSKLEALGLDYILDPTISFKEQARKIKSWTLG